MTGDATTDSHVRFMGPVFAGYGLGWLDAATAPGEEGLAELALEPAHVAADGGLREVQRLGGR